MFDDDILSQFRKYLQQSGQSEQSGPAELVESTFAGQPADVARAARCAAIPHWFNLELMTTLLGDEVPGERIQPLFETLISLPLVQAREFNRFAYRTGVRDYLNAEWLASDEPMYVELHRRAHKFFDERVQIPDVDGQDSFAVLTQEQTDFLREKVYHLLVIQPDEGYALLDRLFHTARRNYLLGEAAALVRFGREHVARAPSAQVGWRLDYYDAVLANVRGSWFEAQNSLQAIPRTEVAASFQAEILMQLGQSYVDGSRLDQAIDAFEQSREIWDRLHDRHKSIALTNNLGNVYLSSKNIRAAERSFKRSLKEIERFGTENERAVVYNNLGNVYAQKRDWRRAIRLYERSLTIKQKHNELFGVASTLTNIGMVYHQMSEETFLSWRANRLRNQAMQNFADSVEILRRLGARSRLAQSLYRLALVQYQMGNLAQARQNVNEAVEIFQQLKSPEVEGAKTLARQIG